MKFKLFSKKIAAVSLAVVLAAGSFAVSAAQNDGFAALADGNASESEVAHVHNYTTVYEQPANFDQYGTVLEVCDNADGKCDCINKMTVTPKLTASLSKTSATYTGKDIKVTATVKTVTGVKVKSTVSAKVKNVGLNPVTITVKDGAYDCSTVKNVKVTPAKASISKLTAAKKAFTVKVKLGKGAKSVQVQYTTDKKFKKSVKTVSVTSSKKITKLSAKKTYYVRVRSLTTVDGKDYVSAWSSAKKIKTK